MISPIENHRQREKGLLVYPVYSRRSGGLSLGINLFPDTKFCPFDCPYCEVFPFSTNAEFSAEQLDEDLRCAIAAAHEQNTVIRDICFSGNGEPSLSPFFSEALHLADRIRNSLAPGAALVLISNGAGLLQPPIFSLLQDAALADFPLTIWLKLDAGTGEWYQKMNNSAIPFEDLTGKIKEFAACAPLTIQTMLCAVKGKSPPPEEAAAWENLILELTKIASNNTGCIRTVQIYGKVRPAPEDPLTTALPLSFLEQRAASLRQKLASAGFHLPSIEIYL